jgi:hypothetical protein
VQSAVESPFRGEATWEREDELKEEFPQLFSNLPESRDEILFKGVEFVTP